MFTHRNYNVSVYRAWLVSTDMVQALSTDVTHSVYNKFSDYSPKKKLHKINNVPKKNKNILLKIPQIPQT